MEDKKFIFESAFGGGSRGIQLNVRISSELNEVLEAESKRLNQSVPDFVREWIALSLLPAFFKSKLAEGAELDSKDRALLESYREVLGRLADTCAEIDEGQEKLEVQRVRKDYKGKFIEEATQEIITSLFGSEKAFQKFKVQFRNTKGGSK